MHGQTVILGYGVTGAGALAHLLATGTEPAEVVVVERYPEIVERASELGVRGIVGDCSSRPVLQPVIAGLARCVIVTVQPDETAVLTTMLARDLCPNATILTALRDNEFVRYARRAGADQVVTSAVPTGRALATAIRRPDARPGVRRRPA